MKIQLKCVCNWDVVFKSTPTSISFKWILITKGRAASAQEVAGPQHKKVWEALLYRCYSVQVMLTWASETILCRRGNSLWKWLKNPPRRVLGKLLSYLQAPKNCDVDRERFICKDIGYAMFRHAFGELLCILVKYNKMACNLLRLVLPNRPTNVCRSTVSRHYPPGLLFSSTNYSSVPRSFSGASSTCIVWCINAPWSN